MIMFKKHDFINLLSAILNQLDLIFIVMNIMFYLSFLKNLNIQHLIIVKPTVVYC